MLLMAMTLSLATVSCSDDDDEEPAPAQTQNGGETQNGDDNGGSTATNSIIGTWMYTDAYTTEYVTFNPDGTFVDIYTDMGEQFTEIGRYTLSGNRLKLTFSDGYTETVTVTISGNTLTVTYDDGESNTLTRVVN